MLTAVIAACSGPGAVPDTGDSPSSDSATPAPLADLSPVWSLDQAAEGAVALLAEGLPDPQHLVDAWRTLIDAGQDGVCPGPEEMAAPDLAGCTSEQGYVFAGLAQFDDRGGPEAVDWFFTADFRITTPDERIYVGGGNAARQVMDVGGEQAFSGDVRGSWRLDGDPGWLGQGISQITRVDGAVSAVRTRVTVDGALTVGEVSVVLDRLSATSDQCDGHPQGQLSVRDPSGGWYALDFGADCTGCAAGSWGGEPLGEACLDLRPALAASVAGLVP